MFTFFSRLAVLFVVLPLVATSTCGPSEFWYAGKATCAPVNGQQSRDVGKAPYGVSCPMDQDGWYWSSAKNHCAPSNSGYNTTPKCAPGAKWNIYASACVKSTTEQSPSNCASNEFWWSDRKACMSSESSHAMPPRGSKCPSNGWSWSSKFGCCTPQAPPYGEPQCPGGWSWMSGISQCQPHGAAYPTPSGYARRAPEPSVYMASPYTYEKRQATPSGYPSYYEKRQLRSRTVSLCPGSLTACPTEFANGLSSDYECLDTKTELTSCGGCSSTNEGKDCTAIQGSWNVGCVKSTCVVYTCAAGYRKGADGQSCVPL